MAPSTIQMIPRNPDSTPRPKAENAVAIGMPNGRQDTTKAAITP